MKKTTIRHGLLVACLAWAVSCGGDPPLDEGLDLERSRADNNLACKHFRSSTQEYAPVQRVGSTTGGKLLPPGYAQIGWQRPATVASPTYFAPFSGSPGKLAGHEGVDYVNGSSGPASVAIRAAAAGLVVYVRLGCPQSCMFCHNTSLRECGSGWGNHVVIHHGGGIVTRYAHLKPDATVVVAGEAVSRGQKLSLMGSSGRSNVRHLHFELGTVSASLDPCAPAQSFDLVHDSELLAFQ